MGKRRKLFLLIAAILFACLCRPLQAAGDSDKYDIVIAGAGTGGFSAAIQAARLGGRVALLEESDWIGGQMSAAAVSTMDEGNHLTPPSGIYREFLSRMQAYYVARGKSVGTCYWQADSHCFEPSAIRKILDEMIDEVNAAPGAKGHIDLLLEDRVVRVNTDGQTVTGVVTARGRKLQSKILIDATEYGDVLPLTPARFRGGNFIGTDRRNACTQDITYTMVIKKYPGGVPKELWMEHQPPEYQKWLPDLRAQWQIDGNPSGVSLPVNFADHNAYRGLPDSSNPDIYISTENRQITRTVLNWFNDYPVRTDIFDRDAREKILCEAKLKTLANLYYLQHELKETLWSVANDEGYDTSFNRDRNSCPNIPQEFKAIEHNMPPVPYIRESQRLIGEYTLTAGDIRREHQGAPAVSGFADSIAVGDYADDLHGCDAESDLEGELEHLAERPPGFRSGPFEVPLRSLIPERVDGLLAAEKNISESRLANGATRLQPITMLTGEAAGTLAALAVKDGVQPRSVSADQVQIALLRSGSILARQPMPDLVLGTRPWQAAQFAVVHQWMDVEGNGFAPREVVTRAQAAIIVARAFELNGPAGASTNYTVMYGKRKLTRATYSDVPLYSDISAAVEAWHTAGSVPACAQSPALFCPEQPITLSQFADSVAAIVANRSHAQTTDHATLLRDVNGAQDKPLTRVDAALILLNSRQ
jgi:FAD dependent oxidoreductase